LAMYICDTNAMQMSPLNDQSLSNMIPNIAKVPLRHSIAHSALLISIAYKVNHN
jgi:hypothetical protein